MSADIDLKEQTWAGVNKMSVPLEGGGRQVFSLGSGANLQAKSKTYTPTASQQADQIRPDTGYDGLSIVSVTINGAELGPDIPVFSIDISTSPATVTCNKTFAECKSLCDNGELGAVANISPVGIKAGVTVYSVNTSSLAYVIYNQTGIPAGDIIYNTSSISYTEPSGILGVEGTPTATKVTVTNHSVGITPKVTNVAGYIYGGTKTGTAVSVSASELVSGSETKTQNGTYDVTNLAELVVNVQSGASNFVEGTFTTGASAGVTNINIPYTGSGYPIMCVVVIDGGAYHSGTSWYTSTQRYAIGQWTMTKSNMTAAPSYTTSGAQNQGVITAIYKNSTSSSTSYTRTSAMNTNVYSSNNASNSAANTIKLHSGNVLSYYVNTSSYGLHPNMTYRYFIVYSE